jgi:hypothetical protein
LIPELLKNSQDVASLDWLTSGSPGNLELIPVQKTVMLLAVITALPLVVALFLFFQYTDYVPFTWLTSCDGVLFVRMHTHSTGY